MESYLIVELGDLGDPVIDLVEPVKSQRNKRDRGRVQATYSPIDPKGSKE